MTVNMGATIIDHQEKKVQFKVFAFNKKRVNLIIKNREMEKEISIHKQQPHIYSTTITLPNLYNTGESTTVLSNLLYKYKIKGKTYPDPYSNYQPAGVHGFSQLIDHQQYQWYDARWRGNNLEDYIIMEIHVGTFSQAGTFQGVVDKLDYLKELGINTIELMPITQTPGRWNWGYDGTNLFSINHNYGTPDDFKYLIDCCHQINMGVILDIVYNHFGPEGNYLPIYGPYFTDKHQTPWGPAVNYDDAYCKYTRQMVLDNIHYWLEQFHLDGLRLDAVQTIKDESPTHILREITDTAKKIARQQNRKIYIIAETDQNNVQLINPAKLGGYGIDAQWMDDFHHCIHTALTGEKEGYYIDYGHLDDFKKIYKNYLYTGQYSKYWDNERGTDAADNPGKQFIVAIQNHDQVGNRARGDRLSTLVGFPYLKVAAGLMILSAYVPLLFMGEEYGEENPFLFFTDYQDPELQKAVTEGRKEEFANFTWKNVPDPQSDQTFYRSKLTGNNKWHKKNHQLFNYYKDLIKLRNTHPVLKKLNKQKLNVEVDKNNKLIKIRRWNEKIKVTTIFNIGKKLFEIDRVSGKEIFNSNHKFYGGDGDKNGSIKGGQMIIFENQNTP